MCSLKEGIFESPSGIKSDLSPEERHRDSVLLKERWRLIQSGIPRSEIKIWDSRLYVKKVFGYFDKSELQYCSSPPQSSPTSTDHLQSDVQTLRENTPLSHNAPPFVPDNSTIVSQSPSATALITDPTSSLSLIY